MGLSELNLSKWHELGNFSNFNNLLPNSVESDLGPLEGTIMHFWHKVATEEASEHSTYDSLLIKKNAQKFFWPKMVEFGSVEISEPPKSTILGWGG